MGTRSSRLGGNEEADELMAGKGATTPLVGLESFTGSRDMFFIGT